MMAPHDPTAITAFLSYSWDDEDHKRWVHDLAKRLRHDGITATLDQWHAAPGDQLPDFMERSIRDSQYVFVVCTHGYKERSDTRRGGVGYEGDIITGELMLQRNHSKFIPLLRRGEPVTALPSWLSGKYFIDLRGEPYSERHYEDLLATVFGTRPAAPPVGHRRVVAPPPPTGSPMAIDDSEAPLKILGIMADHVTRPRMDGTRGSALYEVPFRLSRRPDLEWTEMFIHAWNRPVRFTQMHRPGIASVDGQIVWLRGTTLDEVERYHRDTLKLAVNQANDEHAALLATRRRKAEARFEAERNHRESVEEAARRITFD